MGNIIKEAIEKSMESIKDTIEEYMKSIEEPFCSEADFQFSLALFLTDKLSDFNVILEYPVNTIKNNYIYIDICLVNKYSKEKYYIELKYKTTNANIERHGIQNIILKKQQAQDLGRYFFIKDINRIEQCNDIKGGFCLLLTNDHLYYDKNASPKDTLDQSFRINDGNEIKSGFHSWKKVKNTDKHWTTKYPPIQIQQNYKCDWKECLGIIDFQYLLLQVDKK